MRSAEHDHVKRMEMLGELEAAKMQESENAAMESITATVQVRAEAAPDEAR